MKKDGVETLVPGVDFVALEDISYHTIARRVLEANRPRIIRLAEMQLIWDAVGHLLIRFECSYLKEQ